MIRKISTMDLSRLVNTSSVSTEEINRWFTFKESYSMELVDFILKRYGKSGSDRTILDPFMGAGSTILKSLNLGNNAIGFDVNPIGVLSTNVKTRKYSNDDVIKLKKLNTSITELQITSHEYPNWAPMERYIRKDTLDVLMSIYDYTQSNYNPKQIRDILKLLWLSIIEDVSDYKKDGNGIKYRQRNIESSEIINIYAEKVNIAISDIESNIDSYNSESKITTIYDSSMNFNKYKDLLDPIDAIITSPPYANCFDYFEVYKVELWMGQFIKTQDEWKILKKTALRSNMNSDLSINDILDSNYFFDLISIIYKKVISGEIKNKRIPTMLHNYFFDLKTLLSSVKDKLNNDAIISIIVGNSAYGGKVVPTDKIIIDIAENLGYKLIEHIIARPLRTSSQQMKLIVDDEKELLRESIIILSN